MTVTIYPSIRNQGSEIILSESGANVWTFDATTQETMNSVGMLTEYPLDSGGDANDHFQNKQLKISIRGVITNSPLGGVDDPDRIENTILAMQRLKNSSLIVNINTGIKTYQNMVLTEFSYSRKGGSGSSGSLEPEARFTQVTLVQLKEVAIPQDIIRAENRAKQKNQSKEEKDQQAKEGAKKSWAISAGEKVEELVGGVGDLF
jgi:hypothetical protein